MFSSVTLIFLKTRSLTECGAQFGSRVTDAHGVAPGFHMGPGDLVSGTHALFDLAISHIVRRPE